MTKEEGERIKSEILEKEGTLSIGNSIVISEVVYIQDVLNILNSHIKGERG